MNFHLLILDDQPENLTGLISYLEECGYEVTVTKTEEEARKNLGENVDIAIFDANLLTSEVISTRKRQLRLGGKEPYVKEEGAGIRLAKWTKAEFPNVGIIIYSGERTSDSDQILGLELGADNYIIKPTSPENFEARVRALLRLMKPDEKDKVYFSEFSFDIRAELLTFRNDINLDITNAEFKLLRELVLHPNTNIDRDKLCYAALGRHVIIESDRAIDTLVSKLRRKFEQFDGGENLIKTVRGKGYRFEASVSTKMSHKKNPAR